MPLGFESMAWWTFATAVSLLFLLAFASALWAVWDWMWDTYRRSRR